MGFPACGFLRSLSPQVSSLIKLHACSHKAWFVEAHPPGAAPGLSLWAFSTCFEYRLPNVLALLCTVAVTGNLFIFVPVEGFCFCFAGDSGAFASSDSMVMTGVQVLSGCLASASLCLSLASKNGTCSLPPVPTSAG